MSRHMAVSSEGNLDDTHAAELHNYSLNKVKYNNFFDPQECTRDSPNVVCGVVSFALLASGTSSSFLTRTSSNYSTRNKCRVPGLSAGSDQLDSFLLGEPEKVFQLDKFLLKDLDETQRLHHLAPPGIGREGGKSCWGGSQPSTEGSFDMSY